VRCGRLLREARTRHGLGQIDLARLSGTEQPAISRIERDVISPRLETLNRIFEAMGETIVVSTRSINEPPRRGGNQSIAELRTDYRELSPEDRLAQAALLSEIATELAARSSG
jgi:transcriptional regulator with XRE-family HTH domain